MAASKDAGDAQLQWIDASEVEQILGPRQQRIAGLEAELGGRCSAEHTVAQHCQR
jgi:hypothetical protein